MSEQINSVRRHNTQAARRTTRKLQNWMSNSIQRDRLKQLCFTTYVVINMKSPHFFFFAFWHLFFPFFFFLFFSFFFSYFFSRPSTRQKPHERRTVPIAKRTIFFCKNSICGPRWTSGFRKSPFEGARFRVSHCFFFKNVYCWCWCQSSTVDVSSVVGALWRCGVLMTWSGIAGIGLGHLLGREHDSTPQSGVKAPRLFKRSSPRLHCCCCCCFGNCLVGCV